MPIQEPPKPDPNTYWVVPGQFLAGAYPGARDPEEAGKKLRRFLQVGVRHFINLTEMGELEPYAGVLALEAGSTETSYQRIPIRDVSVPEEPATMLKIIDAIDHALQRGGATYVHCSMALCLAESLIERRGFDAKDQMDRYCRWHEEGYLSSDCKRKLLIVSNLEARGVEPLS